MSKKLYGFLFLIFGMFLWRFVDYEVVIRLRWLTVLSFFVIDSFFFFLVRFFLKGRIF